MTTRLEGSVTSISWIPSEAVTGMAKLPFAGRIAHYDEPPPDSFGPGELAALRDADRFRFANRLHAVAEFDATGAVTAAQYLGGGMIGATTLRFGGGEATVAAVPMGDRCAPPEIGPGWVRFVQSAGGRTGVPAPRRVRHPPFVQFHAPTAWTTLALTLHADGRTEHELVGASPFPRHWIYDNAGTLVAKSGLIDFHHWYQHAFGKHTPWGDLDSPALATEVESALERALSHSLLRGDATPQISRTRAGATLVNQAEPGDELLVVLDGVVAIEVDGQVVAELGPGVVLGERALLEGGRRTSTVRAVTRCTVARAGADAVERQVLEELATGHRRELPSP